MKLQDLVNKYNIVASNKLVDSALCDKIRWNGLANNQPNTLIAYLCKATSIEKLINFKNSDLLFNYLLKEEKNYLISKSFERTTNQGNDATLFTSGDKSENDSRKNGIQRTWHKSRKRELSRTQDGCPLCYIFRGKKFVHEHRSCGLTKNVMNTPIAMDKVENKSQEELDRIINDNKTLVERLRNERNDAMEKYNKKMRGNK